MDIWGSTLTSCVFVQFATGIMLWMAHSPSSQTAWESVDFIQEEINAGWLLRGIHHYAAQSMTALLILHLMQVAIDKAYTAARRVVRAGLRADALGFECFAGATHEGLL